ncbi:MAG: MmgE/PrpD family protein [Albidovulum sp.]|nr:MmgE/PrpD family protein [Albidovulum sp.]
MKEPSALPETVSETYARFLSQLGFDALSDKAVHIAKKNLVDAAGLCIAARNQDYMRQILSAFGDPGPCTAIGHASARNAADAALINGVAIHGEDFDDTLEGAPIRVGAMVVPAVLAEAEHSRLSGERAILGIVAGLESVCRLNHVAAGHMHRAGFHPVGVIGALGAAAGVGVALGLDRDRLAAAFGIAASFASGIIEYLTDGAWTKRLHPGWAAQSGLKAARIAASGFFAPRTVFDGQHNFFKTFAPTARPDYRHLAESLGTDWYMTKIVFKPYACGTMIHPYIDCARRLARQVPDPDAVASIVCDTGEGLVHRLWEPLAGKHRPPSGYAAKFSMPFCMALGYFEGDAGLAQFSDEKARNRRYIEFASKISYRIDPENEYPSNYSGHLRVELKSGEIIELRQPHMRGGMREPLEFREIVDKFHANATRGGWPGGLGDRFLEFCESLESAPDLLELRRFRQ